MRNSGVFEFDQNIAFHERVNTRNGSRLAQLGCTWVIASVPLFCVDVRFVAHAPLLVLIGGSWIRRSSSLGRQNCVVRSIVKRRRWIATRTCFADLGRGQSAKTTTARRKFSGERARFCV